MSSGPGEGRGPFTQSSVGAPSPGESVSSAVCAVGPSRRTRSPLTEGNRSTTPTTLTVSRWSWISSGRSPPGPAAFASAGVTTAGIGVVSVGCVARKPETTSVVSR